MTVDKVVFKSGAEVNLNRADGIPDGAWNDLKQFIQENENVVTKNPDVVKFMCENPDQVKMLRDFASNSEAIKSFLTAQFIVQHFANNESEQEKAKLLENDPELKPVFDDVKANGPAALQKYYSDEELMRKISAKMGGIGQFQAQLDATATTPVTLHEAARNGKVEKVQEFLKNGVSVDQRDFKGVTALGYAVGHNHGAVAKVLLQAQASLVVDSQDNTAFHYAAGYGREELLEILQEGRIVNLSPVNNQGMTPVGVAEQNKQLKCAEALRAKGGK
jgi:hypothetical protein